MADLERLTDTIIAAYLLVTAALVVVMGRQITHWTIFLACHVCAASAIFSLQLLPASVPKPVRFVHDWYPLPAFLVLYKEVEVFAAAFGNWGLTGPIRQLETSLFHGQPTIYLSQRLPWVPLSEYLHFCYFSYLLLVPVIGGYWYARGRTAAFRELLFLLSATYLASFTFFILFPVDSPFYLLAPPGQPLSGYFFYDLVHFFSKHGGARGGAFPSTHVSVSTVVLLVTARWQPRLAIAVSPVILGLIFATVYGRFHYVLDAVAGLILASSVVGGFRLVTKTPRQIGASASQTDGRALDL